MQPSRGATVALRMGCVSVRRYAHRLVATTRRRWPEVVARRAGTLARRAGRAPCSGFSQRRPVPLSGGTRSLAALGM